MFQMLGDYLIGEEDDHAAGAQALDPRVKAFTDRKLRGIPAFALTTVLLIVPVLHRAPFRRNVERSYSGLKGTVVTNSGLDAKGGINRQSLSAAEARLVSGSMRAILETGISEGYFHQHFQLVTVIDKPGDRRVVWKFSISEYEAILNDAVGYYSSEGGDRVDVHSIKDLLGSSHDIKKTIPRKQAERIMRQCIGRYTSATIVFKSMAHSASLFMIASPADKNVPNKERREREEKRREEGQDNPLKKKTSELDKIDEEVEKRGPSYFGIVNLETGKCTKGKAVAVP